VALVVAPAVLAALGGLVEILLLRRIYQAPELYQLVLTFGLALIAGDAVRYFWGTTNKTVSAPPLLAGSISVLGQPLPLYYLLVIAFGPLAALGLWWILYRTRWGILVRAATEDREMVAALGMDHSWLFTMVFVFGTWLAALSGALVTPLVALTPGMDTTVITEIGDYFRREIGVSIPSNYPLVGSDFNATSAGIHADGVLKSERLYNIFNTDKVLRRPLSVNVTDKSGVAGIAFWINAHVGPERRGTIDKRHPGIQKIAQWVEEQYRDKRTTAISDAEMLEQARLHLPDLFPAAVEVPVPEPVG
jgi:hypothetical protein